MNRKGLSKIIVTILFILLVLVAVAIIWVVVLNLISKEAEISEAQSVLLNSRVDFRKIQFDSNNNLSVIIILQKLTGISTLKSVEIITSPPIEVDVISVADLSGSMRACHEISNSCCSDVLSGNLYIGNICYGIPLEEINDCTTQCSGTLVDSLTLSQDANKQLVDALFKKNEDLNQLGLVAYSNDVIGNFSSELINNNETLKSIIDSWDADEFTCICCGINEAINKLSGSPDDKLKTIIVMSDGEANRECVEQGTGDANQDAINAACDAYNNIANLTIYTVSLGDADESTMNSIATS